MITGPIELWWVLAALAAAGLWLGRRYAWAARVSPTLLVIVFGAVLSNLGVVPVESPVYGVVTGPVTSLAIVWLLLAVDLRDLAAAGPKMLGGFAFAVVGTIAGAVVAVWIFNDSLPEVGWKLAGVMTGTYAGGSLNFVSVGRAIELPGAMFAAAAAADNVMTAVWMGVTLAVPAWLGRRGRVVPPEPSAGSGQAAASLVDPFRDPVPFRTLDVALLAALGLGVVVGAEALADRVPGVPSVVWLTTLALLAGCLGPVRRLKGALHLGILALHLFFVVIGIACRFGEIATVGPAVLYFTATVVAVHGVVVFGLCRLARIELDTAAVASQAAVGGPSTALALALARGRAELALPGTIAGLLGYAVGTYAGLAVAYLLHGLL